MKRKILTLTMASVACVTALTMAGCGKKQEATQETATQEAATEEVATQIDLPINTETEKPVYTDDTELTTNVTGSILDEIDGQLFYFSSGVGGWATELKVYADGTFEGHYYDSDMGDTGDDYPNGTQYDCRFKGKFSTPEQVSSLPEGYVSWANMALNGADKLPFYGIYNEDEDAGFIGDTSSDSVN